MKWHTRLKFIDKIADAAVEDWQERHICLPSVTIALAAEGTDWGHKSEYMEHNCLFPRRYDGIHEYETVRDAVRAHNNYLATWRAPEQIRPNWEDLGKEYYILAVQCLQAAEYPYSPEKNYEAVIVELIERYGLTAYDEIQTSTDCGCKIGHG